MRVQVQFPETPRHHYTYHWIDAWGPLEMGEWVVTPANHWKPQGVAKVVALESDYDGNVALLVGRFNEEF
jgi:hypothetical protein